jgi:gamma-glutamylcyclotransferase (GGCT)/AIG2-like uncharacterized protein YtfP
MDDKNNLLKIIGLIGSISSITSILIFLSQKNLLYFLFYFLLVVFGAIIGYLLKGYIKNRYGSRNKIFNPDENAKYNDKFYDYFNKKIKSAQHDIYLTGEGFEFKDQRGKEIAHKYLEAHREALAKGVTITRLQTKSFVSDEWNYHLKSLLTEYPNNFKLFNTKNNFDSSGFASICVIDDDDDKKNVVEFMFTVRKTIGVQDADLASVAIFIENNKELCLAFKKKILDEIKNEKTTEKITLENIDHRLTKKFLYFSYGSNMDIKQMKERCPSAVKVENGCIDNYTLVFNRKGDYRDGGVASIEPAFEQKVHGVIFEITEADFNHLDDIENPKSYVRKQMPVYGYSGNELDCYLYLAIPQGDVSPDKEYLELLINAAKVAKLPKGYISFLDTFRKN